MNFTVGNRQISFQPERLLIAGYTSKDQEQLQKHIEELQVELGVEPPPTTPMIYDLSPELLTTKSEITVVKNDTSGEAEVFIAHIDDEWYVGLGSDHTDRKLESVSVQKSKQVCLKPISKELWPLSDIENHWDEIELKSWVTIDDKKVLYQSGKLSEFMEPNELVKVIKERDYYSPRAVIFCGTLPLLTDVFLYGEQFHAQLYDPIHDRAIELNYDVQLLKDAEEEY